MNNETLKPKYSTQHAEICDRHNGGSCTCGMEVWNRCIDRYEEYLKNRVEPKVDVDRLSLIVRRELLASGDAHNQYFGEEQVISGGRWREILGERISKAIADHLEEKGE